MRSRGCSGAAANQRMKLTGAAILVSPGMKVSQAAPAAYPYRCAAWRTDDGDIQRCCDMAGVTFGQLPEEEAAFLAFVQKTGDIWARAVAEACKKGLKLR